ncbi:MAG: DUF1592 domain-containing protein [Planctomycetia bacterium]|nr:DUF1592 domain-containing protein [Planctomycetia bacterium]
MKPSPSILVRSFAARAVALALAATCALIAAGGLLGPASRLSTIATAANPPAKSAESLPIQPYLTKHCVECHSGDNPKAGLALANVRSASDVLRKRKSWENLLEMVESQAMPPEKRPQPTTAETQQFVAAVRKIFDDYDRNAAPDPGRVTMRRLNRVEYDYTIRDLFYGLDAHVSEDFPADDVGHGFDNIGDVLSMSPVLMERYLAAAEQIAKKVMPTELPKPTVRRVYLKGRDPAGKQNFSGNFRILSTKPAKEMSLTGPLFAQYRVAPNDEYRFNISCYGARADQLPVKIAVFASGSQLADPSKPEEVAKLLEAGSPRFGRIRILETLEVTGRDPKKPQIFDVKVTEIPGLERLGVALVKTEEGTPDAELFLNSLSLDGPVDTRPFAMRRLLDSTGKTQAERTQEILSRFASRAFRRPATKIEVDRLVKVVADAEARGEKWEAGLQLAIEVVLASPKFLFRAELDDRPTALETRPLDEFQLASRLSYFLWSSMPDDALFAAARKNELTKNLDSHVRRMLADPKSSALVEQFAMQWLQLGRLKTHAPDPTTFPNFKEPLRQAMFKETQLFLEAIIREDRSIVDLIDSDFTYMNASLAKFYGVADTKGNTKNTKKWVPGGKRMFSDSEWERVTLADGIRGGILTQAGILTVSSNTTRTSPVKRGKWVLEQILGEPPPPPPPDVPELEQQKDKLTGTLRQRMEQHRANPACAGCHAKMDQLGFAFENFDAIGAYRLEDEGAAIDPSGKLPTGEKFHGPSELRKILVADRDKFARCLAEKMLTFALGRGLEYYDARAIDQVVATLKKNDYKFSALCTEIVRSEPFRLRRGINDTAGE